MIFKKTLISYKILSKIKNKSINIKKQVSHSVLLRAPKHFNIGKHKIKNLNYKYINIHNYSNININSLLFMYNIINIVKILQKSINRNTLFLVNSYQFVTITKFKFLF